MALLLSDEPTNDDVCVSSDIGDIPQQTTTANKEEK